MLFSQLEWFGRGPKDLIPSVVFALEEDGEQESADEGGDGETEGDAVTESERGRVLSSVDLRSDDPSAVAEREDHSPENVQQATTKVTEKNELGNTGQLTFLG